MRSPRKPGSIPSLTPFVVMALVLLLIYGGVLLFPTIKAMLNHQDCVGSGRTDCDRRS